MLSVIVPVCNVEAFLRPCVESILAQTYRDMEILLIDDGSTDGSGAIADAYKDSRIAVYHTEHRGVSAARNLGLDKAQGDLIAFVDADDWIEPNLFHQVLSAMDDADIVCYGYDDRVYSDGAYISANQIVFPNRIYAGTDALSALLKGLLPGVPWGMIARKRCYTDVRYPEGRIFEDVATTYLVLLQAEKVKSIDFCGYHYRHREDSVSRSVSQKRYVDYWLAYKDLFDGCYALLDKEAGDNLLIHCANGIAAAWAWKNCFTKDLLPEFKEMSAFAKNHYPLSFPLPLHLRAGIVFARNYSMTSFRIANQILRFRHWIRKEPIDRRRLSDA